MEKRLPERRWFTRWTSAATWVSALLLLLLTSVFARAEEYLIGEGDVLQVSVYGHADLATTARVSPEGTIRIPLIGEVGVAGRTAVQVAAAITAGLADGFIIDPQVSVAVQESRTRKGSILGKVTRPGQYEFRGRMTLLELLSRAGGLTPDAGNQALIKRKSGSAAIKSGDLVVDLKALVQQGDLFRDVEIMDEDTVTVPEAGTILLAGEVRRPGQFRFEEGMTFVRAVTLAGGFTERAVTDRLKVIRTEGDREQVLEVGGDAAAFEGLVRRGDIVVVSALRPEVCYVTGEVKNAGAYRCERDTNVLKAVALAGGFTDAAAKNRIRIVRRVDGREQVRERVGLEEPVLPDDILVVPKSFF